MLGCWWTGRERDVGLLPVAFTLAFVVHRLKWVRATVSDVRRVLRGKEISGWGWRGGLGQRQVNLRDVGRKHRRLDEKLDPIEKTRIKDEKGCLEDWIFVPPS